MSMKKVISLALLPVLALVWMGAVLPGSKIKDYPHVTAVSDSQWYVLSENDVTKSINGGVLRTNLSTNAYVSAITTSNALVTRINATNAALITTINDTINFASNYLYEVGSGGDGLWTNQSGFTHLITNAPITIGTNSGPPAPLYIFSGITNDSMSGVEMDFAPLAGSGANRSGLYVWMSSGDAIGGYAPAIYGLSEGTTSNGFGAYCGSVPFGMLGKVSSAGSGDSVATIGNNLGSHLGVRYGVSGVAGGPINGNTNVGVFGSGGTNANVAVGVYAELANSISTATDAKYPFTSALILNNRQTAKRLATAFTNSVYEVWSLLGNGHMQLNSNEVYSLVQGTNILFITNGTALTIHGTSSGGGGLTGTTNFIQLSVQAGKPPVPLTNFPGIDPGWQMWEGLYYKTNAEGSIADIGQTWDFSIPNDYATNSLTIHGWYFLESTNGPNTSNTIFRASILRAAPGDSTDIHTAAFGTALTATNTWTASGTGTNKIQQFRIAMSTSSLVQVDDIATLKLERVGSSDTFGGVVGLSRLRIEYTRP